MHKETFKEIKNMEEHIEKTVSQRENELNNILPPSSAWGGLLNLLGKPEADHDSLNSEHCVNWDEMECDDKIFKECVAHMQKDLKSSK